MHKNEYINDNNIKMHRMRGNCFEKFVFGEMAYKNVHYQDKFVLKCLGMFVRTSKKILQADAEI